MVSSILWYRLSRYLLRKWLQFGENCGQILRDRRMNMHCALDDRVWRLRIHDVQQNVNHFIPSNSENGSSQDLFRFCIDADLDETLHLSFFVGPAHFTHRIFRNEGTASGFPYFFVRHAAAPQGRVDIERVGLDPVGNPAMVRVEEIVRQQSRSRYRKYG